MPAYPNHAKRRLQDGRLSLGIGLRQARTVDIATISQACGFDWLFIDMEHNSMGVDTAAQISMAALQAGVTPLVRVPGHESFHASRLLDAGAMGIVVPHVDTPEQAARVVAQCRFPPAGRRSVPGMLPQVGFEALPVAQLIREINEATLVVVMLETPEAIENADAIAAVAGIDVLLVGANDLAAEMGIPGEFAHARMEAAFRDVIAACRRHGKYPGMGGIYEHGLMARYIELGARFILSGSDLSFMIAGAKARTSYLHALPLDQGHAFA